MNYWLLLIPPVSALIGWIGSLLAGQLFTRQLLSRQHELAVEAGRKAAAEFSFSDIEKKLASPETISQVMPVVETHIDDFLRHKLKAKMPMVGMLIGDKTINSLKEVFLKEIEEMFPQVMTKFAGNLQKEFDVQKMVTAKIDAVSPAQVKETLTPVMRFFRFSGAVIGFITGLVNIILFYLLQTGK